MTKKGFTIAETIITIVVLGVLSAIIIPMIGDYKPNKDRTIYSKSLFSLQTAISNVLVESYKIPINNIAYNQEDVLANFTKTDVCKALADNLNTSGEINCESESSYDNPNFKTTDGIKYWGLEGSSNFGKKISGISECTNDSGNGVCEVIYTDFDLTASDLKKREKDSGEANKKGLKILIRKDGKVLTSKSSEYNYENKLIEKSMSLNNNK